MVKVFISFKKEIASLGHLLPEKLSLSRFDWKEIRKICVNLHHKKLQTENITLNKTFLAITENIVHLSELSKLFNVV